MSSRLSGAAAGSDADAGRRSGRGPDRRPGARVRSSGRVRPGRSATRGCRSRAGQQVQRLHRQVPAADRRPGRRHIAGGVEFETPLARRAADIPAGGGVDIGVGIGFSTVGRTCGNGSLAVPPISRTVDPTVPANWVATASPAGPAPRMQTSQSAVCRVFTAGAPPRSRPDWAPARGGIERERRIQPAGTSPPGEPLHRPDDQRRQEIRSAVPRAASGPLLRRQQFAQLLPGVRSSKSALSLDQPAVRGAAGRRRDAWSRPCGRRPCDGCGKPVLAEPVCTR